VDGGAQAGVYRVLAGHALLGRCRERVAGAPALLFLNDSLCDKVVE
jgi:hypothetical protein